MREECDAINAIFFHYIQTGMPYVTLKYAMTMDGQDRNQNGSIPLDHRRKSKRKRP